MSPTAPIRVLLVEDDDDLRLTLEDNLEDAGYQVTAVATARGAREALRTRFPVVILDVMLPDGDGYQLCREHRDAGGRSMILMLTARTLEDDLVRGFECGADDYLAKPYRLRELFARVAALARRADGATSTPVAPIQFGGLSLDVEARRVHGLEGEIKFTRTEFDLLRFLFEQRGRALSRDAILDAVWGVEVVVDGRTVDNFVSNLKKKLSWKTSAPWRIATVRGVGYRFEVD